MIELKPCPFCGGAAKRFTIDEPGDNFGGDVIVCMGKCGASSHVEFGHKENLVSLWNERQGDSIIRERMERLEDALREYSAAFEDGRYNRLFDADDKAKAILAALNPDSSVKEK